MDRLFPCVASLLSERGLFYVVVVDDNDPRVYSLTYVLNVFTARCYASAVLAMGLCPCLSVCVRLSQAGVLLKRQSVGSQNNSTR